MGQRYVVEGPDGKRYTVEGPDTPSQGAGGAVGGGNSPPVALAAPEGSPDPAKPFQRAGGYGPVAAGVAQSALKGYLGLKGLLPKGLGGTTDEDRALLKQVNEEATADPESGWRTAGDVAGTLAATAIPGAGVARGASAAARALPMVGKLLTGASAGAGASGVQGFLLGNSDADTLAGRLVDKAKTAGHDALWGGALGAGGQLATKIATKLFSPTEQAIQLFRRGVNPTLQQGADSKWGGFVGGLTSGAENVAKRQEGEVGNAWSKMVIGDADRAGSSGRDIVQNIGNVKDALYEEATKGAKAVISPRLRGEVAAEASAPGRFGSGGDEAGMASRILSNRMGDAKNTNVLNYDTFRREISGPLGRAAKAEGLPDDVSQRLLAAKDLLELKAVWSRLSDKQLETLKKAQAVNYDYMRGIEATTGERGVREGLSLKRLTDAYAKNSNPDSHVLEQLLEPATQTLGGLTQDMSRSMMAALKRSAALGGGAGLATVMSGNPLALAAAASLYGTSLIGQSAAGARALMGQTNVQRKLAEILKNIGPYAANLGGAAASAQNNTQESE